MSTIYLFRYFGETIVYEEDSALFWTHENGWRPVVDEGALEDLRIYVEGNKSNPRLFIPVNDLEDLLDSVSH